MTSVVTDTHALIWYIFDLEGHSPPVPPNFKRKASHLATPQSAVVIASGRILEQFVKKIYIFFS